MIRIFKFFYTCARYADPRFGTVFGTWRMIVNFFLFPIEFISFLILPKGTIMVVVGPSLLFTSLLWFIPDCIIKKIFKTVFFKPERLSTDNRTKFRHQFLFYLISLGLILIPILFVLIDIIR